MGRLTRCALHIREPQGGSESHVCRGVHRAHDRGVRTARSDSTRGGEAVTANLIGLALAVLVAVYMVAALLFPERF
ncbi:potassium-transporting ATPase subunit F [Nocardia amikacinitolerans]|uniref:potassium-transporting ATPase subunit F n=1 Tax=Nocardia amikacinitolerans TaxID=756689 RepID=UPI000BE3792F|nr:potassium-transporting ATPase subunit F [Nocardia amikacinitolerans]